MKKRQYTIILLVAVLFMAQGLFAGNNMVIKKNDGTVEWKPVSDIDRVVFQDTSTVTDIDGNTYITVQIGDLWWMAENLKTTKYRNGTSIPNVTGDVAWTELTTGAYCYYSNDSSSYADTHGALYNWYAVDSAAGLAPTGWRIPSDDDWKALEMHLGMNQTDADDTGWRGTDEGTKLKNTSGWADNGEESGNGTDEVGFVALPSGSRLNTNGTFNFMGTNAYFWSASEVNTTYAWRRDLSNSNVAVSRANPNKSTGFSVRCVKDYTP